MIGYVCYPARFGGTLAGVEVAPRLPRGAARPLPAPDAPAAGARGRGGWRLRGHGLPLGRSEPGHDGRPRAPVRSPPRAGHEPVRRPRAQPHGGRARLGGPRPSRRPGGGGDVSDLPGPDDARPLRGHAARHVFPELAPGNFTELAGRALGLDDLQRVAVGPRLVEPDGLRRDARRAAGPRRTAASRCSGSMPSPSCGSGSGRPARTSRRSTTSLQALRACARITAPSVIFKAEAIVGPDDLIAYLGVGRHRGRVSDMAYHNSLMVQFWSALATRDARLMTERARRPADEARDDRLGHLHPLSRRHRLGHHRRGCGGRRLGRPDAPRVPVVVLLGRVPGQLRPGRAVQLRALDRGQPDQRDVREPGRTRGRPGGGRSRSSSTTPSSGSAWATP